MQTKVVDIINSFPKTTEGNNLLIQWMYSRRRRDAGFYRALRKEALLRPDLYEEITRYLISYDNN